MKKNKKYNVVKEEHIETTGIVKECLPGTKFNVVINSNDNEAIIKCTLSGKLRLAKIQISEGDSVIIEISPYDLHSGIIVFRHK